ncbi:MAG: tol-pal system-associated acyl-CoA thioesterase [Hydrogenophilaceae bacterium]|jgi:acyl-CoA thioester hydrolase|nr:tol-pal system-associated acyl-CoA thioesterase [Hydrogenophilaceae bacterium]
MIADEPSAGRFDGRVHILPVRIYYEDTDFSGIVYHANYLRYFERGRSDFLRVAGVRHRELAQAAEPIAFAIRRMEIEFVRAARIDDALAVRTTYDAVEGPRLLVSQTIVRGEDVIARAGVEACIISLDGKPKRPPKAIVEKLTPYFRA